MKPIFKTIANQVDITNTLTTRLVSINITDETGLISDKAEILLDDRDDKLDIPSRGAELEISLGYESTGLYKMGLYIVDGIECFGMPQQMRITATASDSKMKEAFSAMTALQSRSWHGYTLIGIVKKIAKEHGFDNALIDFAFDKIYFKHTDQTNESDIAFLQRLAQDLGAFVKINNGLLLFSRRKRAVTLTGVAMPVIELEVEDISNFTMNLSERGKYGSVVAKWHNFATGKEEKVIVGNAEPVFSIRQTYATQDRAKDAAQAKLEEVINGQEKLDLTVIGNPKIVAENLIQVNNLSRKVNGKWVVVSAAHQFSTSGYTCQLSCEKPIKILP